MAALTVVLALFWSDSAVCAVLEGRVVAVADGDTVTVLDSSNTQHKVRLAGIDAPEKRQAFGNRSRQALASMVFGRTVAVDWDKHDRYGRVVGVVRVDRLDAGLEQVKAGMAWHYKAYEREQTSEQRRSYAEEELQARRVKLGLWGDPAPEPPWQFRRAGPRHYAPLE